MTATTLNERIKNAEVKIEKKQATISKKTEWIARKEAKLADLNERDRMWAEFDIKNWKEDIERNTKEIVEIKASLETYRSQLTDALKIEDTYIKEIPETMKRMQNELVERWDEYDFKRNDEMREYYKEHSYKEFRQKYQNRSDYDFMHKTRDEIHKDNEKDAKQLVIDLFNRVKAITGEVTDWSNIRAEIGTWGFTVLNGVVIGKQGKCRVESIVAGGYNIQREHVRVLTHEII